MFYAECYGSIVSKYIREKTLIKSLYVDISVMLHDFDFESIMTSIHFV